MLLAPVQEVRPASGIIVPTPPIAGYILYTFSAAGAFQSNAGTTPAVADGDVVGYLTDQSASADPLKSAANDTTRPIVKLNQLAGYPSVRFDGTNDLLQAAPGQAAPWSVVTVFRRMDSGTGASSIWGNGASRTSCYDWPGVGVGIGLVQPSRELDTAAFDVKSRYVVVSARCKSGDNAVRAKSATQTVNGADIGVPSALTNFRIGNAADGAFGQNDYVLNLVYPSGLIDADLDTLVAWCGSVFGLF